MSTEYRIQELERKRIDFDRALIADEMRITALEQKANSSFAGMLGAGGGSSASSAVIIKAPGGGITGRSGTTLGSGTCDIYTRSAATITPTGTKETVYNVSSAAVAANKYGFAVRDADGALIVVVESCA